MEGTGVISLCSNAPQPSVQPRDHRALKELQNSLTAKSGTEKQSLPG